MKTLDIRPIIKAMKKTVESHELSVPGQYCRWLWQDKKGTRQLGVNEYGCADAANILYTINEFFCDADTRASRIKELQALQHKDDGMFCEATHHTIHTTAHCTAALQLFDAKPLYALKGLYPHMEKEALWSFLDNLDWNDPWPQSHQGAGIYAALVNADEITEEFQKNYFEWFWENADPKTGFWKTGYAENAPLTTVRYPNGREKPDALFSYMGGGFHYMFNHEYARMPLRYPERIIDTCITLYQNGVRRTFGESVGFIEADWVYCINRASRQTNYRNDEVHALLEDFAEKYVNYLCSIDYNTHEDFNDLHMLFGCSCALAELQEALPGKIISEKPLRLVLNRRPFI
jgi:hypothetical protein